MNYLRKNDAVKVCHKSNCIEARGKNGEMIAFGATVLLLMIGVSALVKAVK